MHDDLKIRVTYLMRCRLGWGCTGHETWRGRQTQGEEKGVDDTWCPKTALFALHVTTKRKHTAERGSVLIHIFLAWKSTRSDRQKSWHNWRQRSPQHWLLEMPWKVNHIFDSRLLTFDWFIVWYVCAVYTWLCLWCGRLPSLGNPTKLTLDIWDRGP